MGREDRTLLIQIDERTKHMEKDISEIRELLKEQTERNNEQDVKIAEHDTEIEHLRNALDNINPTRWRRRDVGYATGAGAGVVALLYTILRFLLGWTP